MGYSENDMQKISFYIGHHDDFISYKNTIPDKDKKHIFIREVNKDTIKEMVVQNQIDWKKLGIDCYLPTHTEDKNINKRNGIQNTENSIKKKYICSYLANGVKPEFIKFNGQPLEIDIDIEDIKNKIATGDFFVDYIPTEKDYKMLLEICKADASAQSEKVYATNLHTKEQTTIDSKERKISTMQQIESVIEEAYKEGMQVCKQSEISKFADSLFENETFNFNTFVDENAISH
jgi:hypothetical protein